MSENPPRSENVNSVVDLNAERDKPRRKGKEPPPPMDLTLYFCDCGCGIWRLYADGPVECINCGGIPDGLRTVTTESL